jgi:diguanylate cyclase (GGDEF)-like protein
MSGIVRRLAKQDYDVEVLPGGRQDEIGDMNEAIQIFRDNGLERERLEKERQKDRETKDLILQLMHRLQACHDESELGPVVSLYCSRIFPGLAGEMLIMNDGRTVLRSVSTWGDLDKTVTEFSGEDCWALRRARPHLSDATYGDIPCQHVQEGHPTGSSLCVPLAAQGDTVGLLHFHSDEGIASLKAAQVYIELIAENLGLATANLQLRARLTNLATIDPLTGVLNRRSLDHNLNCLRRENIDLPAALVMIDIDYFKRFNDEFGHEAGDHVMQHVAAAMSEVTREQGQVHRFGGEEFAIILRSINRHAASLLAEKVRQAIEAMPIIYQGRPLGRVTISAGIASTEGDQPVATLMPRADAALLMAKSQGRNRVVTDWPQITVEGKGNAGPAA